VSKPSGPPPAEGYESRLTSVLPASRLDELHDLVVGRAGEDEPTQSHVVDALQTDSLQTGVLPISAQTPHIDTDEQTSDMPGPQPRPAGLRSPLVEAAATEGRLPLGSLLAGRYRIDRLLGRGGMGEVYCADDLELGQRVAIKLLPEGWEQDAARLARLRSEVRLARSVSHPHVCRVYDIGEIEGRRFLSMEYIDGEDLESLLRRIGRLPPDKAAEIGLQICQGLAAIHENGILHRDLKPANLMLDTRGRIRIADFGLASLVEDRPERGLMQGTPAYMAPEQLGAMEVSIQTDLYALGLILYKLLTGRPAFAARSVHELLRMRTDSAPPRPSALVNGIVPAVDAIVVRCLAPNPSNRPISAREVAVELAHGTTQGYAAALVVAVASSKLDRVALAAQAGSEVALRVANEHERILDELCPYHGGTRASSTDDIELTLFEHPGRAVAHTLAYQRALARLARHEGVELPVRMGVHVGVRPRPDLGSSQDGPRIEVDAVTRDVATNLCKLAGPHQILMSRGSFDLARQETMVEPDKIQWLAHGSYEISGMAEPLEVCEVGVEGLAPLKAPRESALARRRLIQDVVVGWRPSPGMELPSRPHWIMERKLGEGGFGEVWLATHTKTRERRVFKFCYDPLRLRALQREITLFRLLKETLGDRDDIVRILDWSFEEAPYFIESAYTAGGDLIDWAAAQGGLAAIALDTRLAIVAQVATALAAAHSVGVLHKDVKPANVLMAMPEDGRVQAQLGDFGIGALAQTDRLAEAGITALGLTVEATIFGAGVHAHGTRLYMAPEIIEGKPATVQADIYALGVMLYQVVVGDFTRSLAPGWERDIDDALLRADVAAAVDGNPQQRLGSAALLADKLRALPERRQELEARKQELLAREQELEARAREREEAERTRAALARVQRRRKIALVVAASLLLFAGVATVQSLRIAREARAAAVAGETAQQVSSFMVTLFEQADPYASKGRDISAREILDRGKARIDVLADQPEVQATLLHVMGVVYGNIGRYQESAALLEQAVEKRRAIHGGRHLAVAESLHALARTSERLQAFEPAERAAREALELRRALLGNEHLDTVATLELMADVLKGLGRLQEARPLYEEVLAIRRRLLGSDHALVAQVLRGSGRLQLDLGEYTAATQRLQEALDILRRLPGDHAVEIARAVYFVGLAYLFRDDLAAAEPLFRESLASSRKLLGNQHPLVAESMERLGVVYRRSGRYAQAEQLLRELLDLHRASMGEASPTYATLVMELALLARVRGDCEEARALSQHSIVLYRQSLPDKHAQLARALNVYASLQESWSDLAAAEQNYREALEMSQSLPNQTDAYGLAVFMADLANLYLQMDEPEKAGPLLTLADETLQRLSHEGAWYRAHLDSVRGLYASKRGDLAIAERLLLDSLQWLQQHHGPHRIYTQRALARVISFYESTGRLDEAREYRLLVDGAACKAPTSPAVSATTR
jgi:serine/threonine protein kinase